MSWVEPGSLGFALGFVGFIRVRLVHSGSLRGSLDSSGVGGFIWIRRGGHLGVVGFTLVRPVGGWVHPRVSPWYFWVHSRSLGSLGSAQRVIGFTRVRPGGRWVHPGSLVSLGFALGFIRCRWVHSGLPWGLLGSSGIVRFTRVRPWNRWVLPRKLGSLGFALRVVGFIRDRWGSSWRSLSSSGVVGFTRFCPGDRLADWGSFGSLGSALVCLVHPVLFC